MDNFFVIAFAFWPAVALVCAGLNMLISWTFSWSELIFAYLIGMVSGIFLHLGMQPDPHWAIELFFVFSHGLFAVFWVLIEPFRDSFSEPATFLWMMAGIRVGAIIWAAAFDHISAKIGIHGGAAVGFSFVVFWVKWPFALITSAFGILIWLAGCFAAIGDGKVGFAGGVLWTEFKPNDTSGYHATTVGWTVHCWFGPMPWKHELYHTRQYIYMSDWLIPFWLVGAIWGAISGAATGQDAGRMATAARGHAGNPIEVGAYKLPGT